jgi:2-polyprenyl-3-methyl-5-hydroxy-6-metoxy-1,4-benzoquinol methylase
LKATDRFIQALRIRKAANHLPGSGRILDVGCGDGALFRHLSDRPVSGVGIDPDIEATVDYGTYKLIKGWFPTDLPSNEGFDAITMLATLEHVPPEVQREMAAACSELLNSSGRLIITVPSKRVDPLLNALKRVRLIDGMALEQHYGFDPQMTPSLFSSDGLTLVTSETFEAGLNHLFVFEKTASPNGH